jgi:hypothetical protein
VQGNRVSPWIVDLHVVILGYGEQVAVIVAITNDGCRPWRVCEPRERVPEHRIPSSSSVIICGFPKPVDRLCERQREAPDMSPATFDGEKTTTCQSVIGDIGNFGLLNFTRSGASDKMEFSIFAATSPLYATIEKLEARQASGRPYQPG